MTPGFIQNSHPDHLQARAAFVLLTSEGSIHRRQHQALAYLLFTEGLFVAPGLRFNRMCFGPYDHRVRFVIDELTRNIFHWDAVHKEGPPAIELLWEQAEGVAELATWTVVDRIQALLAHGSIEHAPEVLSSVKRIVRANPQVTADELPYVYNTTFMENGHRVPDESITKAFEALRGA